MPIIVQRSKKPDQPKKSFIGKDGFTTPKKGNGNLPMKESTTSKDSFHSKEKPMSTGKPNLSPSKGPSQMKTTTAEEVRSKPAIDFKNTRMCSYMGKCKRKECSFAHSIEVFQPPECRFGEKCKSVDSAGNITCRFKHVEESKEAFLARSAGGKA